MSVHIVLMVAMRYIVANPGWIPGEDEKKIIYSRETKCFDTAQQITLYIQGKGSEEGEEEGRDRGCINFKRVITLNQLHWLAVAVDTVDSVRDIAGPNAGFSISCNDSNGANRAPDNDCGSNNSINAKPLSAFAILCDGVVENNECCSAMA